MAAIASKKQKKRRIRFSLKAPDADEVILMGDFNQWDVNKHPMRRDDRGVWTKDVVILPGKYEYKFLVDGRWQIDPGNKNICPNCFGTLNNVLEVESR